MLGSGTGTTFQALQSLWIKHSDMEVRQRQSFGLEVLSGEESGL